MIQLKGNEYLLGFMFQMFFWKVFLFYVLYHSHKKCNASLEIQKAQTSMGEKKKEN